MGRFLIRLLGVGEDDGYQALYAFFLVLSFASWAYELISPLLTEKQKAIGLVADWTGASIGTAVVAILVQSVPRLGIWAKYTSV